MMTVHEVSKISGVSIRALHHYDRIGLLPATEVTNAGYRLYDDTALERLQHILLFKELEFSLKEIKDQSPESEEAVGLAKRLQDFITEHFYTCTDEILLGLGAMYAGGGDFTINIDKVGGEGTAEFADKAIRAYCGK